MGISSTIYMDYEALVHYKVKHSKNEFVNNHINGIENFWLRLCLATVSRRGYTKHRLSKFKGIENRISCFI